MCNKTYRVQSNAVSCANPKCSLIMCMLCFVRDFLRNLVKSNQYQFILTIPCCACQVDDSFRICAWRPTTKCPNFYSVMKEDATTHLSGIPTELMKISGQFFRARLELNRIINTSCEAPFSKPDQRLIKNFCTFIKMHIGHHESKSHFTTEMKFTTRAFRWMSEADVPAVAQELKQLKDYLKQFNGLKQLMLDCAVLLAKRVMSSPNKGPSGRYDFEESLMVIHQTRELEQQHAGTRVIDLTSDGLEMI